MPTIEYKNIAVGRQVLSPAQQAVQRVKAAAKIAFQEQMSVDGVFEGGGALGTAYLGGLRALHDNGIWFKRVAGNSAGAITAAMIAVGFTAPEIQWLSSGFVPKPPALAPDTLSPIGITRPIPFADFLDLPSINSISTPNKQKTLLWKALIAVSRRTSRKRKNDSPQRHRGTTEVYGGLLCASLCYLRVSVVKALFVQGKTAIKEPF